MQQPEISIHPLIGRLRFIYDLSNLLIGLTVSLACDLDMSYRASKQTS